MPIPPSQTPAWRAAIRLKATSFAVRASRNQAARWGWWASRAGFRSVGTWLATLGDAEVERQEQARGVYDSPPPSP